MTILVIASFPRAGGRPALDEKRRISATNYGEKVSRFLVRSPPGRRHAPPEDRLHDEAVSIRPAQSDRNLPSSPLRRAVDSSVRSAWSREYQTGSTSPPRCLLPISASLSARNTRRTSLVPSSGPTRHARPSASVVFMKVRCPSQSSCSSSGLSSLALNGGRR